MSQMEEIGLGASTSESKRPCASFLTDSTSHPRQNVGEWERWISAAVGTVSLVSGLGSLVRGRLSGLLATGAGAAMVHRGLTGKCALYNTLGINTRRRGPARFNDFVQDGAHVEETFTIERPARELYDYWRQLENLPSFMKHLKSVTTLDERRSRWVLETPLMDLTWEAEITEDVPGERIAWRSTENADIETMGVVRFESQGEQRTEVHVILDYLVPYAGRAGTWLARAVGRSPESLVREDLRRFKQLMEAGEIPTIEGQPTGRSA